MHRAEVELTEQAMPSVPCLAVCEDPALIENDLSENQKSCVRTRGLQAYLFAKKNALDRALVIALQCTVMVNCNLRKIQETLAEY
jgi:hypothetical protein